MSYKVGENLAKQKLAKKWLKNGEKKILLKKQLAKKNWRKKYSPFNFGNVVQFYPNLRHLAASSTPILVPKNNLKGFRIKFKFHTKS